MRRAVAAVLALALTLALAQVLVDSRDSKNWWRGFNELEGTSAPSLAPSLIRSVLPSSPQILPRPFAAVRPGADRALRPQSSRISLIGVCVHPLAGSSRVPKELPNNYVLREDVRLADDEARHLQLFSRVLLRNSMLCCFVLASQFVSHRFLH